jgi:hypothetical protein
MNNILFDYLDNFYTIYLNNILIYSDDPFKHEIYVRLVLQRLQPIGQYQEIRIQYHLNKIFRFYYLN